MKSPPDVVLFEEYAKSERCEITLAAVLFIYTYGKCFLDRQSSVRSLSSSNRFAFSFVPRFHFIGRSVYQAAPRSFISLRSLSLYFCGLKLAMLCRLLAGILLLVTSRRLTV